MKLAGADNEGGTSAQQWLQRAGGLLFRRDQWRRNRWYLLAVAVGVLVMVLGNWLSSGPPPSSLESGLVSNPPGPPTEAARGDGLYQAEARLAADLARQLNYVHGAGQVGVLVSLDRGEEQVFAEDSQSTTRTTSESDAQGGQRTVSEASETSQLLWQSGAGSQREPLSRTRRSAKIRGVLVVASGADQPQVRADLTRAVQILLDVPSHRIAVITGGDER